MRNINPILLEAKQEARAAKAKEMQESRSSRDQEVGKKMLAKRRHFANVIDRKNEEKGVQIVGFPKTVYEQLLAIRDDDAAGGNFTDPGPNGFDITITKTGQGMNTKYAVKAARQSTPLCEDAKQAEGGSKACTTWPSATRPRAGRPRRSCFTKRR